MASSHEDENLGVPMRPEEQQAWEAEDMEQIQAAAEAAAAAASAEVVVRRSWGPSWYTPKKGKRN